MVNWSCTSESKLNKSGIVSIVTISMPILEKLDYKSKVEFGNDKSKLLCAHAY